MTSRKMEEHLKEEQPPAKKSRISEPEEQQRGDVEPTGMNADEQNEVIKLATTSMDSSSQNSDNDDNKLIKPTSSIIRQRLPLELECEIFACLKLPIKRKFISGLGMEIYQMCAPKIRSVLKAKKLYNPEQNDGWYPFTPVTISPDGLGAFNDTDSQHNLYAHAFPAATPNHCRLDNFPGTIIYYFEVKQTTFRPHFRIGFEDDCAYSLDMDITYDSKGCECGWLIYGKMHLFECFEDAIKPEWKWAAREGGNVAGCGLLLNSKNKLAIFGTLNGILLGKQIPIERPLYPLYPTAIVQINSHMEANFGTDPTKPFEYDIDKCPGLIFE